MHFVIECSVFIVRVYVTCSILYVFLLQLECCGTDAPDRGYGTLNITVRATFLLLTVAQITV